MGPKHTEEEAPAIGPEPADLSRVLKGIRGDEALLRRLIENFLTDYPDRLKALHQAVGMGDPEAVDREAHALRGTLLLFSAEVAGRLASELEALGRIGRLQGAEEALNRLEAELDHLTEFLARRLELAS